MSSSRQRERGRVPGLEPSVADRIVAELGAAGERALSCLRTAHALLAFGTSEGDNLRLAESAAYNVREALDSVVRGRPAGEGGLEAALAAWEQYKLTCALPDADEPTARMAVAAVLDELRLDRQRQAYLTRKLLDWFQCQTGSVPISGVGDPTAQYQRLRQSASNMLHTEASNAVAHALLDDVEAWFARFFAPPSNLANRLEQLAACPFTANGLVELRAVAMNAHHLRLFLQRVEDAGWLEPLRDAGLIGMPVPGEAWPVAALTGEPRRLPDDAVVELLWRFSDELSKFPVPERASRAFEIARTAWWLGRAGHALVIELLRRFPTVDAIQAMAMLVAGDLEANDPAQFAIADAVIGNEPERDRGSRTRELVSRLIDGMTEHNVDERFGLIAVKLRRLASRQQYLSLDIVALSAESVDEFEDVLGVAQRLAAAIARSRALGMSSSSMLKHISTIPGELGDRLTCLVYAGAEDIDRQTKLSHLAKRLASRTATGDDRALLHDLTPLDETEIAMLRDSFGTPPPAGSDADDLDRDSARAWRWSMLLPRPVLDGWERAIAAITAAHGTPDPTAMDHRTPTMSFGTVSSPLRTEDLAALDPREAARQIAAWRPSARDPWGVSGLELARTLESLVKDATETWTHDPVAMVRTLREPVYIDHYLRAVTANAASVRERAPALIRAIDLARSEQWEPTTLGGDPVDFADHWGCVDSASVELIDALADANADLEGDLDSCWDLATELTEALPADLGSVDDHLDTTRHDDPLHHAINSTYGKAFQAVLALGGWEHRNRGEASSRLSLALSRSLSIQGSVGLQFRAVIAASRPFVETIATKWIDDNQDQLFGDELGRITFDQTLKYSRPTRAFFDLEFNRLIDGTRRGADNAAAWLLIAHLWDVPGYTFERIINGLTGREPALTSLSSELARLAAGVPDDQHEITTRAFQFSMQLLAEAGNRIPAPSLAGLGGWALDTNVDATSWLEMTEQTLLLTEGTIYFASEVAERCRDLQPSPSALRILAALLGHGDRWEQYHIDSIAHEGLRAAAKSGLTDDAFHHLRERLIQRGRHDARSVTAATGDASSAPDDDAVTA